jgi:ribonuclease HI
MIVTINTDASFSHEYKIGTFAFWIVSNEGRVLHCGKLKGDPINSQECETKCILNAIACLKGLEWKGVSRVIINTDCYSAISLLRNKKKALNKPKTAWAEGLLDKFNLLKKGLGKIEFRHVKAHTSNSDARSYVNRWCDEKAKEIMRENINLKK